ncbi:3-hydroxybutyryl-CoA dehydrogenase [Paenibacillus endophyticus]|uniref:3-hydroxybutyryl-CoA dehydrogenase n=1 Tax=Paenibacillus endophyticus TaxID=1294268 RepID=A0A7W5C7I4_9BACL|nr:3-hydroxybutyryl-CoA dehydrogenase [Paenibacillus endophyticus]MBB3151504.1 3-hydroxybutyryl-CoA dehydrogenase [Paenibacillus endophyticus]
MGIQTAAVLGAGQMGSGIAQTLAGSGIAVLLYDLNRNAAALGLKRIGDSLNLLIGKGKMEDKQRSLLLSRITISTELADAQAADLVIEAAPERMAIKKELLAELDRVCSPHTILATNTSSLSITELASATGRPSLVIGMHFMNPVPVMPLVEIIRGLETSDATYDQIRQLSLAIGKTPVEVRDFPGFVSNRILMLMINEAIFTVYEGVATPEAVDEVMKLGMKHPMGPIALADFIGLDTCLAIMETLHHGFGDSKYRPCPLLSQHVKAGWLGRKTGRGFYIYP